MLNWLTPADELAFVDLYCEGSLTGYYVFKFSLTASPQPVQRSETVALAQGIGNMGWEIPKTRALLLSVSRLPGSKKEFTVAWSKDPTEKDLLLGKCE